MCIYHSLINVLLYGCFAVKQVITKSQIQKRGLQIVYDESHISLEELLIDDQGISVHRKHINPILTEIYKTFSGENPYFMTSIFIKKM